MTELGVLEGVIASGFTSVSLMLASVFTTAIDGGAESLAVIALLPILTLVAGSLLRASGDRDVTEIPVSEGDRS